MIDLNNIIDLYCNKGISICGISKLLTLSSWTITKLLKENNIEIINKRSIPACSDTEIIDSYNDGLSITKISKKFKTNRSRVSRVLLKNGIEIINKQNRTKFNSSVFDVIDTEEKSYWLGFIFADGSISKFSQNSKNRYQFEISLKLSDKNHLEKFNKFMEYEGVNLKIKNSKLGKSVRWVINNKHLWETLNSLGCIPNKSLKLEFPKMEIFKEPKLVFDFIRGYFDGDGCISYTYSDKNKNNIKPLISILGTEKFLKTLQNHLGGLGKINKHKNIFNLRLSTNDSRKFFELIYLNPTIFLERKYKRIDYFKSDCRSKQKWLEILANEIEEDDKR